MKTLKENIGVVLVAGIVLVSTVLLFQMNTRPVEGAGFQMTNIGSVATTSSRTSVTTSARILSTTTNATDPSNSYVRVYASICNPNANPVFLNLDGDKVTNSSTGGFTTVIAAAAGYSACYEITDRNQYLGSITASSTNQTATVISAKEYVQ